jgi:hypothetical protein
MTPALFTSFANHAFARRWWLVGASAIGFLALFLLLMLGSRQAVVIGGTLAGPLIAVPWGLFCACVWFHPQRGNLQSESKWVGKLPPTFQVVVRWYSALFLTLFLVVGAVVWPVLAASWL